MKDVIWHSGAIIERVARNQVKTSTGSIYLLQGKMNSALMRKEGKKMIVMLQTGKGFRFMTEHTTAANVLSYPANWAQWEFSTCWEATSATEFWMLSIVNGTWQF